MVWWPLSSTLAFLPPSTHREASTLRSCTSFGELWLSWFLPVPWQEDSQHVLQRLFLSRSPQKEKEKKKREKGTILNSSSHLSPLALGEVGASHSPWEFAAMVTAQQQAASHASNTRQALGQLAGLPGARSLAGAEAWNLRACKYCSSRGSGINGCL